MRDYTEDGNLSEIRLVACDMDRTLLADDGSMPPQIDRQIRELREAGVVFCAASGRPLVTLEDMFAPWRDQIALISDNGGAIESRGEVVSTTLMDPALVRELTARTLGLGLVPTVVGVRTIYVRESDRGLDSVLRTFYHSITYLGEEELRAVGEDIVKFTVYLPAGDAAEMRERYFSPEFSDRLSVTCGGPVWVDVTNPGVNKGTGLLALCDHLGIDPAHACAFGDTDNDAEMLRAAGHGYLMANGEKRIEPFADFRAPSNNDRGVSTVIDRILAARR